LNNGDYSRIQINGIAISTTVIVSFHSLFLTKVDRAYRINCFYMEATKTVTQVRAHTPTHMIESPSDDRCVHDDHTRTQQQHPHARVPI
jgi:hypothetical protein